MHIHAPRAFKHGIEIVHANDQRQCQPNGRPDGIASSHPVPEAEAVVRMYAECVHRFMIGRCRREMICDGIRTELARDPLFRRIGVGDGLERREGLGANDEQRPFRIKFGHQVA